MSSKNGLGRLYDRLTPDERFRLDMEAMARGDEVEARRLVESCPKRTYTQNDDAFVRRCEAAKDITLCLCIDLLGRLGRLQTVKALREVLPYGRTVFTSEIHTAYLQGHEAGSRYAWVRAGKEGDPPGWMFRELEDGSFETDEEAADPAIEKALEALEKRLEEADIMPPLFEKLEHELALEAAAIWQAFTLFCREELALEPEKLVKVWMEPALSAIEAHREALDKTRAGRKEVEECRHTLGEVWKRVA